jgi:amino acid adenylation domain-containing protein
MLLSSQILRLAAERMRHWSPLPAALQAAASRTDIHGFGFEVRLGHSERHADLSVSVQVPDQWSEWLAALAWEYDLSDHGLRARRFFALHDRMPSPEVLALIAERPLTIPSGLPAAPRHLGFSDDPDTALRICFDGDVWPRLRDLLAPSTWRQLQGEGRWPAVEHWRRLGDVRFLNIDNHAGRWLPHVGIECHLRPGRQSLVELIQMLGVDADEADALLSWGGSQRVAEDGYLIYHVTHVKIVYGPKPVVKAYLACSALEKGVSNRVWTAHASQPAAFLQAVPSELKWDWLLAGYVHQLEIAPDALAVLSSSARLTYRDLYEHAAALAAGLEARGVKGGELVAVCVPRGWRQVVAVVGILLAGAAYLPLEWDWPEARRNELLERAGCRVVLGISSFEKRRSDWSCPAPPRPDQLAYVIYTSGSTGRPKGTAICHGSAYNTVQDINDRFQIGPGDRVLGVSALTFDLSVYDIFGPLSVGGAVVVLEAEDVRNGVPSPEALGALCQLHGVTIWNSVPAMLQWFMSRNEIPSELRLVLLSGDWIPPSLPPRVWQSRPDVTMVSLGGATEASIWSILHPISRSDCQEASIPYGSPRSMRGQAVWVLNEKLEPSPVEEEGELFIAGVGVALEYWREPELTAQAFLEHPTAGRIYRTGDLGRLRSDGEIILHGRKDSQVKIGGFRIELSEIESRLLHINGVDDVVVVACKDGPRSPLLVGWYVGEAQPRVVRQSLRAALPHYMVPAYLLPLAALPTSANQKIDRAQLASWSTVELAVAGSPSSPAPLLDEAIETAWCEALGLTALPESAHFFELGGASFAAMNVAMRLSVPPHLLYDNPLLEDYVRAVRNPESLTPHGLRWARLTCEFLDSRHDLEERYPGYPALGREQLLAQVEHFPEGQWIVLNGPQVVGAVSSLRIRGGSRRERWSLTTAEGTFANHDSTGEFLYIADLLIEPAYVEHPVAPLLLEALAAYLANHAEIVDILGSARVLNWDGLDLPAYLDAVKHGRRFDAGVSPLLKLGAELLGPLPDYDSDEAAGRTYAAVRFPRHCFTPVGACAKPAAGSYGPLGE